MIKSFSLAALSFGYYPQSIPKDLIRFLKLFFVFKVNIYPVNPTLLTQSWLISFFVIFLFFFLSGRQLKKCIHYTFVLWHFFSSFVFPLSKEFSYFTEHVQSSLLRIPFRAFSTWQSSIDKLCQPAFNLFVRNLSLLLLLQR